MLRMLKSQFSVIIPNNVYPVPNKHELSAARILAGYLKSDVICQPRANHKTPDFFCAGLYWELKSPIGTGKYNIQHALRSAAKQSSNIILDARFSKLHILKIKSELNYQFRKSNDIKRLLLIDKQRNIIDFSK